jgi:hypothetical protein
VLLVVVFGEQLHVGEVMEHLAPVFASVFGELLAPVPVSVPTARVILTPSSLLLDVASVKLDTRHATGVATLVTGYGEVCHGSLSRSELPN